MVSLIASAFLCFDEKHRASIRFLELCLTAPGLLYTINHPLWPGAGAVRQSSTMFVFRVSTISVVHFKTRPRIVPAITLPCPLPVDFIFMRSHLSFPTTPNSDANAYFTPRKQKHEEKTLLLRLPDSRGAGHEARL